MTETVFSKKHGLLYKLDTAAKIFPASSHNNGNHIFRMSAYLKNEVDPGILQKAVYDLQNRFPSYYVRLYYGFFWNYLIPISKNEIVVREDTNYPCRPYNINRGGDPLLRIFYHKNRISAEFLHVLTDGYGGMIYIKTLTTRYLELIGEKIDADAQEHGIFDVSEPPPEAEFENAYIKYLDREYISSRKEPNAYHYLPEKQEDKLFTETIAVSLSELKNKAKVYGCSLSEFIVFLYSYAFLLIKNEDIKNKTQKLPLRISAPANLRNKFPSKSLKNFSIFANIDVDEGGVLDFVEHLNKMLPKIKTAWSREALLSTSALML